jgi:hypothetical protein
MPAVRHDGTDYYQAIELLASVPPRDLRHAAGSIRSRRDDITRALDWLFTGV